MNNIKIAEELLTFMSNNINYGYLGKNRVYHYYDSDFTSLWFKQYAHYDSFGYIGNAIANYNFHIYNNDKKMTILLNILFDEHPLCVFSNLTDKATISTLNYNERCYVETY